MPKASVLGAAQGTFRLHSAQPTLGSMLEKHDIIEILGVSEDDVSGIPFTVSGKDLLIDERQLQKLWYAGKLPNSPPPRVGSATVGFDELVLAAVIKEAYPGATISRQVPWGRKRIDLRLSIGGRSLFVEFCGPGHFTGRYGPPADPRARKDAIEKDFQEECVLWPYWIPRCAANVSAMLDERAMGFGALWSTAVHFGDFAVTDACELIQSITGRFKAGRSGGYGYFYDGGSEGRTVPRHPVVRNIANGAASLSKLLPRGYTDIATWIPDSLQRFSAGKKEGAPYGAPSTSGA